MPKTVPDTLAVYSFHGLNLGYKDSRGEYHADCPWCGKTGKFHINEENGLWRCWRCGSGTKKEGGDQNTFIRLLLEEGTRGTTEDDRKNLCVGRRILFPSTLAEFGIVKSVVNGDWLIPGYDEDGNIRTVYRYMRIREGMRVMPTPTKGHHLYGMNLFDPSKKITYVCEGIWDTIALWEMMNKVKMTSDGKLVMTANQETSLGGESNVIGVPGCRVFKEEWLKVLEGSTVVLMFDNDHPIKDAKTGRTISPAGFQGIMRTARICQAADMPPESIRCLVWGNANEGYDPELPSGFDVRDFLTQRNEAEGLVKRTSNVAMFPERIVNLGTMLSMVQDVPQGWIGPAEEGKSSGRKSTKKCTEYRKVVNAWRKALRWTDGLDCALSVMLASVASVMTVGDQLWVKIIGPASCGKSTLCEAISTNAKYVIAKSTIRGFHSGYGDPDDDCSLVARLHGKTLVTKDGDTLLQSPNLGQILSEARDIYDSTSRTHYRNKVSHDYIGIRTTWLLCGTNSLRSIDSSELGERFLDCVIMDRIDEDLENDILWRVANRTDRSMSIEVNGKAESQYGPEMAEAMRLTGGYIDYLKENTTKRLENIKFSEDNLNRCCLLAKYVAILRARPSIQDETQEREFSSRLVGQIVRLAKCLALVMNRQEVDEEVMRRVRKVADDTSRGITRTICETILQHPEGLQNRSLSLTTGCSDTKIREMTRFLRMIDVLRLVETTNTREKRWQLTETTRTLMETIHGRKRL